MGVLAATVSSVCAPVYPSTCRTLRHPCRVLPTCPRPRTLAEPPVLAAQGWPMPRPSSPVPVERGLVLPHGAQRLVGVRGYGRPDALVRALQGLVVGREDVQAAGHPRGGEVRQVLAALFLLVDLPLVAIPPGVPALGAAGREGRWVGWGQAEAGMANSGQAARPCLQASVTCRSVLEGNSRPLQNDQPQSSSQHLFLSKIWVFNVSILQGGSSGVWPGSPTQS